jgi:hypothetical protein
VLVKYVRLVSNIVIYYSGSGTFTFGERPSCASWEDLLRRAGQQLIRACDSHPSLGGLSVPRNASFASPLLWYLAMRLGSGVIVAVFLTLLLEPNTAVRAYWLQPVELRDIATDPQVVLPDGTGTVTGTSNPVIGQDSFLGIPFAQPPTENLRFAKPVALAANSSRMISATQFGYVCPQATVHFPHYFSSLILEGSAHDDDPLISQSASLPWSYMSEDCLSVNILRPSNLPANASLPILVWIYGGGYSSGASSEYNGSAIVTQSMMRVRASVLCHTRYNQLRLLHVSTIRANLLFMCP